MFGLVYDSIMINEEDVVYLIDSRFHFRSGMWNKSNLVHQPTGAVLLRQLLDV